MAKFYKNPFAYNGDFEPIADGTQSSGKVSNEDGFTSDYELLKSDPNYRPVGRKEMNGIFHDITEALGDIQVQGASDWLAGAQYKSGAIVRFEGDLYILLKGAHDLSSTPRDDLGYWQLLTSTIAGQKTETVGVGGDYIDLNVAIEFLRHKRPVGDGKVKLILLSDSVISGPILVDGDDLSWIEITSAPNVIQQVSTSLLNLEIDSTIQTLLGPKKIKPLFVARNGGKLPKINAEIELIGTANAEHFAVAVESGGEATIGGNNQGFTGGLFFADGLGSKILCERLADFEFTGKIEARNCAIINMADCTLISSSLDIEATTNATIYANNLGADEGQSKKILADNASIFLDESSFLGADIESKNNAFISTSNCTSIKSISADENSTVIANGSSFSASVGDLIKAENGSTVSVVDADLTNYSQGVPFTAINNSKIFADGVDLSSESETVVGASAENGSEISLLSAAFSTLPTIRFFVLNGSILRLNGATGETFQLNQTANSISSDGIIFQ